MLAVTVLITAGALVAVPRLQFDDNVEALRPPGNRGILALEEIKSHFGTGFESMSLVLEAPTLDGVLALANASMGVLFVGLARAALEHALAYAKERVQGGVPIFEHQSVRTRLFKMFMDVEAARSLAWRVMVFNSATNPPLVQYSIASKVFSTSTAFEVASAALQIFGGNGLSREYPIEKLMRDARASMIE